MSASRDEKTGKWTAQCYYENWKGEKKHKKKRGFATKKGGRTVGSGRVATIIE